MKTPVLLLIEDQILVAEAIKTVCQRAGIEVFGREFHRGRTGSLNDNKVKSLCDFRFPLDTGVTGEELLSTFRADNPG